MNNPKVSIIIATFNAAKTLPVAMDSVMNQTFQDWECIIVDGASKDSTVEIVKSYVDRDSRFRYISELDKGVYDAFNKGWKKAKGEWVYYLGCDDKLTKEGIKEMMVHENNTDLLMGNVFLVYDNGREKIYRSKGIRGSHQAFFTRRYIFEKLNGFDLQYKIISDRDFMIRAIKNGYKIKNIDTQVAYFSMGGLCSNIKNLKKIAQERVLIYKRNNWVKYPKLRAYVSMLKKMATFYLIKYKIL